MKRDREEIVERGMSAPLYAGIVPDASHTGEGRNKDCKDFVHFDFKIEGNLILAVRHICKACVLTTAMADFLAEALEGKKPVFLKEIEPFAFMGIPILRNGECILLPWEVAKATCVKYISNYMKTELSSIANHQMKMIWPALATALMVTG
jgi:hypothetical protein